VIAAPEILLLERVELVARIEELVQMDDHDAIRGLLAPRSPWIFELEPELGLLYNRVLMNQGRYLEGLDLLEATRAPIESTGDWRLIARHRNVEGQLRFFLNQPVRAAALFHEALAAAEAHGDRKLCGHCNANLGAVAGDGGEYEEALAFFARARALYVEVGGMRMDLGALYMMTGIAYRELRRFADAEDALRQALGPYLEDQTQSSLVKAQLEHARLLLAMGDPLGATALLEITRRSVQTEANAYLKGEYLCTLGGLQAAQRQYGASRESLGRALQASQERSDLILQAEVLEQMAKLSLAEGDRAAAEAHARASAALFIQVGYPRRAATVRGRVGEPGMSLSPSK
jgi:tetratricopeptide (TPR) repeat protein